ncbi:MAG: hypothetical protein QXD84_04095 [Thermoplasmata archaeon]
MESPYVPGYVGPERYEGYDTGEQVINHLIFYKSIISEEDSGQKLSEYMELVQKLERGEHLPIKDPFDKSIALTFELVIQNHLNPWDVDLLKFSKLYMERIKSEPDIDFVTAGRLMFMAWSVLKLQSDEVLASNQPKPDTAPQDSWAGGSPEWLASDASYDFTAAVLGSPEPPIQESVWRKGTRPVTLYELIGAFEEARREAELQRALAEERKKQRQLWESQKALRVNRMIHREDLQDDISAVWSRIEPLSGKIPLSRLCPRQCDEDRLTAFVSVLFLAYMNQVRVWQEDFPRGEVYVEKVGEGGLDLEKLQAITHPARKEVWDEKKRRGRRAKKAGSGGPRSGHAQGGAARVKTSSSSAVEGPAPPPSGENGAGGSEETPEGQGKN